MLTTPRLEAFWKTRPSIVEAFMTEWLDSDSLRTRLSSSLIEQYVNQSMYGQTTAISPPRKAQHPTPSTQHPKHRTTIAEFEKPISCAGMRFYSLVE